MKIDDEFRRLLSSLNMEVRLSLLDDERQFQAKAVLEAQKNLNLAAVPLAYSNAKLHAFERRIRVTIDRFMSAVENCDIELDDAAEKDILCEISHVTVSSPHLNFPPAIKGQQAAAIQQSYAQKMERLRHQLYKETANRLREEKIKGRSRADANASSIRAMTEAQPRPKPDIQSTGSSKSSSEQADFNSGNNSHTGGALNSPTTQQRHTRSHVRLDARKLETQAMYRSWKKEYRSLKQRHPNKFDSWYAHKISTMGISKERSAETIRKRMKR